MTTKTYAGIGSRSTPADIQNQMTTIANGMAKQGYTLRSGAAEGADRAFELGCDLTLGSKEIYLPWRGFNGSDSMLYKPRPEAFTLAQNFHPNWNWLTDGGQKLMARNAHQLFGQELNSPVDLVICWTARGMTVGGTGQAIRMAEAYDIPIVNLGDLSFEETIAAINTIIDPVQETS